MSDLAELIDIAETEVMQPDDETVQEAATTPIRPGYPTDRNRDVVARLVNDLDGQLLGYRADDAVWHPVVTWETPYLQDVGGQLLRLLDENELASPGITCYLAGHEASATAATPDNNWLWGVLYIEDWYEECIDYERRNLSRGDPTVWDVITTRVDAERAHLQQVMADYTGGSAVRARDRIHDHEVALFGQAQVFYIEPLTFQNMTTRVERGNPDYPVTDA